jgi:hypothetical protein
VNRVTLFQEGTYAPDSLYRFLPSPAMDKKGNIGIGYSVGGASLFPGQRFAGRLAGDPLGILTGNLFQLLNKDVTILHLPLIGFETNRTCGRYL